MAEALKIEGLTKTYANGVQALKGVDLTIEAGDFFALLGPNGAGKSTLFKKIIPEGIEYLNADSIARTIREKAGGLNVQDIANRGLLKFSQVK